MSAEVASATVALLPTFKGGAAAIGKQLDPAMGQAGESSGQAYGSGVLGTFKKFAAPLVAVFAGAKAIEFIKDSVGAASDLAEAGTAVGQVFGDSYSKIEQFAAGAATTLGQSTLDVLDASKTFGVFGQAAGLTGDELVGFSTNLVQLSTDLASFQNTSPEEAVEALGAALRGESEPLRRYGVLMDDASLKAIALEKGIVQASVDEVKVTAARRKLSDATSDLSDALGEYGEGSDEAARSSEKVAAAQAAMDDALGGAAITLTPAQRTMAAYQLILEQTSTAQGDFARTSGGLANQQRILAAQTEDFKAKFGAALLPLFTSVVTALNDDLFPALEGFLPVFAEIASDGVPKLLEIGKSFEPIIESGFNLARNVLPLTGTAFTTLVGAAAPVLDFLADLDPALLVAAAGFIGFVKLQGPLSGMFDSIGTGLAGLNTPFDGLNTKLKGLPAALGGVTSFLGGPWGLAIGAGAALLGSFALQEVAEAKAQVDSLTQSFDENTGAITDNTRAVVFKALQDSGAIAGAKELGINLETLTDAALGNAAATAQVRAVTDGVADDISAWSEAGHDLSLSQQEQVASIGSVIGAIGTQNQAIADARQNFADEAESQGLARKANEDFTVAVQAATDSISTNGATLDQNTAQGIANQGALQGIADKATSLVDTQVNLGASTYTLQTTMQSSRDAFIQTAEKMGLTRDQAAALADQMLQIPGQKVIDVVANTYDALAKIDALNVRLDSIRSRQVEVTGTSQAYGFAGGGTVFGPGSSKSDSIPAWLSNGEEIIQEPYASRNRALLKAINSGMNVNRIGFASGGTVGGGGGVSPVVLEVVNKSGVSIFDLIDFRISRHDSEAAGTGRAGWRLEG